MLTSSRHRDGRAARAEVNRRRRGRQDVAGGCTVAQLSVEVIPPTLQVAVVEDGTREPSSSRNGHGRAARTEVN